MKEKSGQSPDKKETPDRNSAKKRKRFNIRIFISLSALYIGIIVFFSGFILVLYGKGLEAIGIKIFIIGGEFMGMDEFDRYLVHTAFGLLLSAIIVIHLYYNIHGFISYFGRRRKTNGKAITSIILTISYILSSLTSLILYFTHWYRILPEDYTPLLYVIISIGISAMPLRGGGIGKITSAVPKFLHTFTSTIFCSGGFSYLL